MWSLVLFLRRRKQARKAQPKAPRQLVLESLESRSLMAAADVRSLDGTGNNLAHTDWGSAGSDFLRTAPAAYADGLSAATTGSPARPSARVISNSLASQQEGTTVSDRMLSAMIYAWGQFIDHDLDLTASGTGESLPIPVPAGDPWFDPTGTGTQVIPLSRSGFDPATGTTNARQQVNQITAWLDGSMVYGSDAATAASLRTFSGGKLKTSEGNLLPTDAVGFFQAGDIRVSENPELASLQTLFMREHNRLAEEIAAANPSLSDESIYQQARALVGAEIQVITYKEWLPALLGQGALKAYRGYDRNVNPGIANEFATAAFRLGHSMLGDDIEFLDNNGLPVRDEVSLAEAFFNTDLVKDNGIDPILKYLASDPSSEIDNQVVDSVRNFLFGPPGAGGLDLASLNIQRGRDHGLADYNSVRGAYGLKKVTSFTQITSDVEVQTKLKELYGNVNNIDAWVGMLAEDHVRGASVGETLKAVISNQFERLRAGDRFWYQNAFSGAALKRLEGTTLTDVIRRNTNLTNLQQNAFFFKVEITGQVFQDANKNGVLTRGEQSLAGRTVELLDAGSKEVLAATQTDARGMYRFDVENGLGVGQFLVREVVPAGWVETSRSIPMISITRGDTSIQNVNFGVVPNVNVPLPPMPPTGGPTKPAGPASPNQPQTPPPPTGSGQLPQTPETPSKPKGPTGNTPPRPDLPPTGLTPNQILALLDSSPLPRNGRPKG